MTLKIGVIGCGGIAGEHMRGFAACEGVKVVACSDISLARAKSFARDHGIEHSYDDFHKMLESEKLDAVSVCTPNYAHCEPTVAALKAGAHVLCEKPIAMNCREAELMVRTARETGRLLTIGHHFRFVPHIQFLKRRIEEGVLGHIYFARSLALRRRGIPGWGQFHIRAKSGGGPLIDIGVHTLDTILWLMGSPEAVAVSGKTYRMFGHRPDFFSAWGDYKREEFDVEDFAAGFVRLKGDITLVLETSWAAHIGENDNFTQVILGDCGGVTLQPFAPQTGFRIHSFREEAMLDTIPSGFPEVRPHIEEIRHWVNCIRGEAEVLVKPEECLNVQRIIDALYLSSDLGREILVADLETLLEEQATS